MIRMKHFLYLYFWLRELAISSDQKKLFLGIDSDVLNIILHFGKSIIALPLVFWRDRQGHS